MVTKLYSPIEQISQNIDLAEIQFYRCLFHTHITEKLSPAQKDTMTWPNSF